MTISSHLVRMKGLAPLRVVLTNFTSLSRRGFSLHLKLARPNGACWVYLRTNQFFFSPFSVSEPPMRNLYREPKTKKFQEKSLDFCWHSTTNNNNLLYQFFRFQPLFFCFYHLKTRLSYKHFFFFCNTTFVINIMSIVKLINARTPSQITK